MSILRQATLYTRYLYRKQGYRMWCLCAKQSHTTRNLYSIGSRLYITIDRSTKNRV